MPLCIYKDIHGRREVLNNAVRNGRLEGERNLQWFDGTQICAKSWCTIHGVALSRFVYIYENKVSVLHFHFW